MKTLALVLLIATPLWGLTFENYSFIDNITATTDGGYVVSGSQYGNGSWIAKYMPGEGFLWQNFPEDNHISITDLTQNNNDGCLAIGWERSTPIIVELDINGNVLWGINTEDSRNNAVANVNDGWIVVGDRKIKKILPGGIIEWSQEVEGQGHYSTYDLRDVATTPDGGCLVVGNYAHGGGYELPCVARLNAEGEVLWWRFYDLDCWGGGAMNVARGADGTWGVSGYMYQLEPEGGDPACFAHIDDEGNLLNVKTYKRLLIDYIGGIESNGDDGWVFAGGYLSLVSRAICDHTFNFGPWGAYYINAALIEIDYDGEVINSLTSKNTNGYMSVNGLTHAHDGRWLLYGYINPYDSFGTQSWIDWFSFD